MNDAVENATALFQTEFLFLDGILKYLVFLTVEIVVFLHEFMKCRPVDFFLLGKLLDGAVFCLAYIFYQSGFKIYGAVSLRPSEFILIGIDILADETVDKLSLAAHLE